MRVEIKHVLNGYVVYYQSGMLGDKKDSTAEIYVDRGEAFEAASEWFDELLGDCNENPLE